jgi:hypothetical protein
MNTKSLSNLKSLIYEEVRKAKTALNEGNFGAMASVDKNKTLLVAKMVADAISKVDNVNATVNMKTLEPASFDIDLPNDEFAGGSYNMYADGSIRNHAAGQEAPIYGNWKTDNAAKMAVIIKGLIETYLGEELTEAEIKKIKEAHINKAKRLSEAIELGSRVKVIGQGLEDQNKTGVVEDIAPGGKFYTVKIKNQSAYFHESDLKVIG